MCRLKKNKRWKKNHDRKSMTRKVYFRRKKTRDRRNNAPRYAHTHKNYRKKNVPYRNINAPQNFSLIENVEEVLDFIDKVRHHYKKNHPIFINMDNVSALGNGAVLLLLANMIQFKSHGIEFNSSIPRNKALEKKLKDSGFFKHLYKTIEKSDDYSVGSPNSIIYTHAQKKVDAPLTDLVIEKVTPSVFGVKRRCPGIQRMLVELMHNTNDHAGHVKGSKHWWLSSNIDKENKIVTLSFMDFGRGIFDSLDNKDPEDRFYGWKDKFLSVFPSADTSEKVMKLILEGQLHKTCTNDYFRGKGLPGIYDAFKTGRIGKLKMISNRVFADIENNEYTLLDHNLHGTFVSCEINPKIYNLTW